MTITETQLISCIESKNGFPLDSGQKQAICHGDGPLLIAAGPGTGKTEVLTARCLKFICCDGVDPGSIMLTTFTNKAAKALEDRITETFSHVAQSYPELQRIELSSIRIGTLHSLCNDILQEYRYSEYQNVRLLDEMESNLLIHREVVDGIDHLKDEIQSQFRYLFGRTQNYTNQSKWSWANCLAQLFNRATEDRLDLDALKSAGGAWSALAESNRIYDDALSDAYSCDFARLLRHFLEFLDTGHAESFLKRTEDMADVRPHLTHVLVDEYQDTNPIQEAIYFRLCDIPPHNLTVVGDDDQALYRFRGGTVECLVGFPDTCRTRWQVQPNRVYLSDNHRSDSAIVEWCNEYITSYEYMREPNVRIAGKPSLSATLPRGSHPALALIRTANVKDCPVNVASLVHELKANDVIQDYSQCVLLLRSAKNSPRNAGAYMDALEAQGIPVHNPRAKDYLEQPEVAQCMGAFIRIMDRDLSAIESPSFLSQNIRELVTDWASEYDKIASAYPELASYVKESARAIDNVDADKIITPNLPTILYRILSHQPFKGYQSDVEMDMRLAKLTRLFEAFCSQYGPELRTDKQNAGKLPGWWYGNFYYGLCGYLEREGMNDDEDEEVICPPGKFPIMTIHQAKGLEFDFVFVGNLGGKSFGDNSQRLENDLRRFRVNPPAIFHSIEDSQWHDDIRLHYVAYSRAKQALVLAAADSQLRKKAAQTASFEGDGGGRVRQRFNRL